MLKKILCYGWVLFFLTSCVVVGASSEGDTSVNPQNIQEIIKGKTPKKRILELFGPPIAIARQGEKVLLPNVMRGTTVTLAAETMFELFRTDNKIHADHIIYYYDNTKKVGSQVMFIAAGNVEMRTESSKLWVLIDNRTGIVDDVYFRTQEKE